MAEWLRRLTRKPKVRTAVGSNSALDCLVAFRNSRPGRPGPCEGNLVAADGSKDYQIFSNNFTLRMFLRTLKEFSKSLQISCVQNSINVCKVSAVYKNLF